MSKLTLKTELRHLNPQGRRKIENLLNAADSWQELINILPKELDSLDNEQQQINSELLINNDKYNLLKQQKDIKNSSPSKALLDYWSTYGKRRPTIEHLIYYSAKCKLNRLVDYIINDLLNNSIDELKPKIKLLVSTDNFQFEDNQIESNENYQTQNELNKLNIRTLDFNLIKKYTNNFDDRKLKDDGNKIGEGGFGKVYLARIPKDELNEINSECELDFKNENYLIAVKVVSNEFKNQFFNELKFLNNFKHSNLLNLIGLSYFKDDLCILSEYMINGSLQDCLLSNNFRPLNCEQRIKNIGQIIDAICYLHTFEGKPLIHRDIKSSNILLDRNFNCKLCDFGLARLGSLNCTTNYTINIIGTSVYMAPESFKGRITVKIDTFSFGIVLFEILTGLPPITSTNQQQININEDDNEFTDILTYLNENLFGELEESELNENNTDYIEYKQKIEQYLDKKAGEWNIEKSIKLFDLARKATNDNVKKRPTMIEIKQEFEKLF